MESKLQNLLEANNSVIRERIVFTICQTSLYGIYLCLVPIAIHAMVTNGFQSRARKWLFAITTSMFALTTMYWIVCVVFTFLEVDLWNTIVTACYGSDNALSCIAHKVQASHIPIGTWLAMFSDILFVNYIIADGVLVWRAWVLCSDQSRIVLMIPVVMLGINTIIYLMTVAARTIQLILISKLEDRDLHILSITTNIINITHPAHLTLSMLVNIFATFIITLKAWKYRKLLVESGIGIRTPRQAFRILAILVESGMIYILIGVMSVVTMFVSMRFRIGEITGISALLGIQLAGIYPIVVILLVEKNRSLDSTYISFGTIIDVHGDRHSQGEPMVFASGSVLASGGETDSVTKPPHNTINLTFGHMLEPGGAGMGAGNIKVSKEWHAAPY